jgi:hypothetical protein
VPPATLARLMPHGAHDAAQMHEAANNQAKR